MAFRIKTNLLVLAGSYVPAREQFERVRCTVLDIVFPFYSLPIKVVAVDIARTKNIKSLSAKPTILLKNDNRNGFCDLFMFYLPAI